MSSSSSSSHSPLPLFRALGISPVSPHSLHSGPSLSAGPTLPPKAPGPPASRSSASASEPAAPHPSLTALSSATSQPAGLAAVAERKLSSGTPATLVALSATQLSLSLDPRRGGDAPADTLASTASAQRGRSGGPTPRQSSSLAAASLLQNRARDSATALALLSGLSVDVSPRPSALTLRGARACPACGKLNSALNGNRCIACRDSVGSGADARSDSPALPHKGEGATLGNSRATAASDSTGARAANRSSSPISARAARLYSRSARSSSATRSTVASQGATFNFPLPPPAQEMPSGHAPGVSGTVPPQQPGRLLEGALHSPERIGTALNTVATSTGVTKGPSSEAPHATVCASAAPPPLSPQAPSARGLVQSLDGAGGSVGVSMSSPIQAVNPDATRFTTPTMNSAANEEASEVAMAANEGDTDQATARPGSNLSALLRRHGAPASGSQDPASMAALAQQPPLAPDLQDLTHNSSWGEETLNADAADGSGERRPAPPTSIFNLSPSTPIPPGATAGGEHNGGRPGQDSTLWGALGATTAAPASGSGVTSGWDAARASSETERLALRIARFGPVAPQGRDKQLPFEVHDWRSDVLQSESDQAAPQQQLDLLARVRALAASPAGSELLAPDCPQNTRAQFDSIAKDIRTVAHSGHTTIEQDVLCGIILYYMVGGVSPGINAGNARNHLVSFLMWAHTDEEFDYDDLHAQVFSSVGAFRADVLDAWEIMAVQPPKRSTNSPSPEPQHATPTSGSPQVDAGAGPVPPPPPHPLMATGSAVPPDKAAVARNRAAAYEVLTGAHLLRFTAKTIADNLDGRWVPNRQTAILIFLLVARYKTTQQVKTAATEAITDGNRSDFIAFLDSNADLIERLALDAEASTRGLVFNRAREHGIATPHNERHRTPLGPVLVNASRPDNGAHDRSGGHAIYTAARQSGVSMWRALSMAAGNAALSVFTATREGELSAAYYLPSGKVTQQPHQGSSIDFIQTPGEDSNAWQTSPILPWKISDPIETILKAEDAAYYPTAPVAGTQLPVPARPAPGTLAASSWSSVVRGHNPNVPPPTPLNNQPPILSEHVRGARALLAQEKANQEEAAELERINARRFFAAALVVMSSCGNALLQGAELRIPISNAETRAAVTDNFNLFNSRVVQEGQSMTISFVSQFPRPPAAGVQARGAHPPPQPYPLPPPHAVAQTLQGAPQPQFVRGGAVLPILTRLEKRPEGFDNADEEALETWSTYSRGGASLSSIVSCLAGVPGSLDTTFSVLASHGVFLKTGDSVHACRQNMPRQPHKFPIKIMTLKGKGDAAAQHVLLPEDAISREYIRRFGLGRHLGPEGGRSPTTAHPEAQPGPAQQSGAQVKVAQPEHSAFPAQAASPTLPASPASTPTSLPLSSASSPSSPNSDSNSALSVSSSSPLSSPSAPPSAPRQVLGGNSASGNSLEAAALLHPDVDAGQGTFQTVRTTRGAGRVQARYNLPPPAPAVANVQNPANAFPKLPAMPNSNMRSCAIFTAINRIWAQPGMRRELIRTRLVVPTDPAEAKKLPTSALIVAAKALVLKEEDMADRDAGARRALDVLATRVDEVMRRTPNAVATNGYGDMIDATTALLQLAGISGGVSTTLPCQRVTMHGKPNCEAGARVTQATVQLIFSVRVFSGTSVTAEITKAAGGLLMDGSQVFLDHLFRALNYPHERNCEQCDPKELGGELKLTSHSIKECLSASLPDVLNFALIPEPGLASSGSPCVTAPLVLTEDDLRAASESGTPLPLRVDLAPSSDLDYRLVLVSFGTPGHFFDASYCEEKDVYTGFGHFSRGEPVDIACTEMQRKLKGARIAHLVYARKGQISNINLTDANRGGHPHSGVLPPQ